MHHQDLKPIFHLENFTPYPHLIETARSALIARQFQLAKSALEVAVLHQECTAEAFLLTAKLEATQGRLGPAGDQVQLGLARFEKEPNLLAYQKTVAFHQKQIENAFAEIIAGKHTSADIEFVRENTHALMDSGEFDQALAQLRRLAEARKAKTTNILWIGHYLKDVYFHPQAAHLRSQFDKLLIDETLFYYLKACKLQDPGYQQLRQALKDLR